MNGKSFRGQIDATSDAKAQPVPLARNTLSAGYGISRGEGWHAEPLSDTASGCSLSWTSRNPTTIVARARLLHKQSAPTWNL